MKEEDVIRIVEDELNDRRKLNYLIVLSILAVIGAGTVIYWIYIILGKAFPFIFV